MSLARGLYTLKKAWPNRQALKEVTKDKNQQLNDISALSQTRLAALNIKVLVLDFDGVLAPHGALLPTPAAQRWLSDCLARFKGKVVCLSNQPKPARLHIMRKQFPTLEWMLPPRKKPYPDGLEAICAHYDCAPHECLMVDDRLLTGVLAAVLTQAQVCWITPAKKDFFRSPVSESFFAFLRFIETTWVRYFVRPG